MRGKVLLAVLDGCDFGITPAYAGKSNFEPVPRVNTQDHPRICGEKINWATQ